VLSDRTTIFRCAFISYNLFFANKRTRLQLHNFIMNNIHPCIIGCLNTVTLSMGLKEINHLVTVTLCLYVWLQVHIWLGIRSGRLKNIDVGRNKLSAVDVGSVLLRRFDIYLQVHLASQSRRPISTSSPPWEPQISYNFKILFCFCHRRNTHLSGLTVSEIDPQTFNMWNAISLVTFLSANFSYNLKMSDNPFILRSVWFGIIICFIQLN
jgi:hypothetical protein